MDQNVDNIALNGTQVVAGTNIAGANQQVLPITVVALGLARSPGTHASHAARCVCGQPAVA
jgi:hypothetical protein